MTDIGIDCKYGSSKHSCVHPYLLPAIRRIVAAERPSRIFDLGCGNGSAANSLSRFAPVTGVDISPSGVAIAQRSFPHLTIEIGSVYDDLAARYGEFPIVVSLEVVEHLYAPRLYAKRLFELVERGGVAIVSTPYHGYLKNLALALSGRLDTHFTALWDGGHIKFWSIKTLSVILEEAGFSRLSFLRVGRVPVLAKSMVAIARKD